MNRDEALRAVADRLPARAAWAYPHDRSSTRAVGEVIAYSDRPMVLIETAEGERVWWIADLVDLTARCDRTHGDLTTPTPTTEPEEGDDA